MFHHVGVVQQNQWFTSMPEFVLLVLTRLLPDFCSRMTQFVPPWSGKTEPRVSDRLINVILREQRVSYIAGRLQFGDRGVKCLPDICSKITTVCVRWFGRAEPNAGNSLILA
jgi:hypothetical protein